MKQLLAAVVLIMVLLGGIPAFGQVPAPAPSLVTKKMPTVGRLINSPADTLPHIIPPPFAFNMPQIRFGAQATDIEACIKLQITNVTSTAQAITKLEFTGESLKAASKQLTAKSKKKKAASSEPAAASSAPSAFEILSPSPKMLPISVAPHKPFEISVCFKPLSVGTYKTRLVIRTATDSVVLPIDGKGMKPEEISKLPKTDVMVIKPKKKGKDWIFKLQLASSSKISLQLFDALGNMTASLLTNDLKETGVYDIPFSGLDKDKKKLPPGNYYLRCVIEEVTHISVPMKFTKVVEIK
ncbi:MAG: hypothetical protein ACHQM6_08885 [Candidatus Kapaibacterium sp.]